MRRVASFEKLESKIRGSESKVGQVIQLWVEEFIDAFWQPLGDLMSADLSELSECHRYLLKRIQGLHAVEESSELSDLMMQTLNTKTLLRTSEKLMQEKLPGIRGCNIYSFGYTDRDTFFVGDLHGDDIALVQLLSEMDFFSRVCEGPPFRVIFLGDYVDRGKAQLKIMERLMVLKVLFPETVFLLRGNHDGGTLSHDGTVQLNCRKEETLEDHDYFVLYLKDLEEHNPTLGAGFLKAYLDGMDSFAVFALLAVGAEQEEKTAIWMGVHGGLPRLNADTSYEHLRCLADLTRTDIFDVLGKTVVHNLLWSDPTEEGGLNLERARFKYNQEHFNDFSKKLGITHLIRGHEVVETGHRTHFDERVHTLFSSGGQLKKGVSNIETAYAYVAPAFVKLTQEGHLTVINI